MSLHQHRTVSWVQIRVCYNKYYGVEYNLYQRNITATRVVAPKYYPLSTPGERIVSSLNSDHGDELIAEHMDTRSIQTTSSEDRWNKYLQFYVAQIDWRPHLKTLDAQTLRKNSRLSPSELRQLLDKQKACTVLLPYYDKSKILNPPENLLFQVGNWHQMNERDWFSELKEILAQDTAYDFFKDDLLDLGIIDPLEFNPITRQAYNWLIQRAEQSADGCSLEAARRFKNLVYIYGGAVICSVFQKPEWQKKIRDLHNWRTGYFFRRLIHEIYPNIEDIKKIKKMEINKLKQAGSTLVRSVKKD